jgi:hypothetical protein
VTFCPYLKIYFCIHALFPVRNVIKTWFLFIMVMKPQMFEIKVDLNKCGGWDGMFSIATHYRLDSPGLEGQDFPHLPRPVPRPTEPPALSLLVLFWKLSGRDLKWLGHVFDHPP